jgi:hypothetical protein
MHLFSFFVLTNYEKKIMVLCEYFRFHICKVDISLDGSQEKSKPNNIS